MVLSVIGMLVDLSVTIMHVTVSVVMIQLEVFTAPVNSFCSKYAADNFYCNYVDGSLAVTQVVFSAVHYANECLHCNYAGDSFFYSYVCDSFK